MQFSLWFYSTGSLRAPKNSLAEIEDFQKHIIIIVSSIETWLIQIAILQTEGNCKYFNLSTDEYLFIVLKISSA